MKKSVMIAALMGSVFGIPAAFANTNAGSKIYVCATAQQNDLLQADYEALNWVEVKAVGNYGETGSKTNILTYDTWDTTVSQKAKGITDAGSPTIELARIPTDPGQIIMRSIARNNLNYAFKTVRNDPAFVGGNGTIIYNRGLVTGPTRPGGKNEDFDLEVFTLGLNQLEVVVNPTGTGVAPAMTVAPVITGTAAVDEVITASTGTFTGDAVITYAYQWFAGGVAIVGANTNSYTLTSAELGKVITVRVVASNASGSAQGFSAPTVAVAA